MRRGVSIPIALAAIALLGAVASQASASERVVGGSQTSVSNYPWTVALVLDSAKRGGSALNRVYCGGALVTPSVVLTAAHCVSGTDPDPLEQILDPDMEPDDLNVVLGRTTLSSSEGAEVDVRGVSYHAGYSGDRNDVGYVVLAAPTGLPPISIAGPAEQNIWAPGSPTVATGWGTTSEGTSTPSNTLRAATVPIISDSSCGSPSVYGNGFDASVMVCAGYLSGGVDTCNGDSGGPLQAPATGGGYRLVGLTNWGDGCARPNAPGVYARVAGDALRPQIAADVARLEAANSLPHRGVIGAPGVAGPDAPYAGLSATARRAIKRCKRIKRKRKRRRCIRRAKRRYR